MTTITLDREQIILGQYLAHKKNAMRTAKAVGVSDWSVKRIAHKHKVAPPFIPKSEICMERVRDLYEAGYSLRQVAELVGRSDETVRRWISEMGVPLRKRGCGIRISRGILMQWVHLWGAGHDELVIDEIVAILERGEE